MLHIHTIYATIRAIYDADICMYVLVRQQFNGSEIYVQRYLIPKTTAKEPPTQRCDRSPYTQTHTHTHTARYVCVVYSTQSSQLEVFILEIFRTEFKSVCV